MSLFLKNPPNALLAAKGLNISSEYTPLQWTLLFVLWLVLIPVSLPLWLLAELALGVITFSGAIAFFIVHRLFVGIPGRTSEFRWQSARAFINNVVAMRMAHWNAPFRRFLFRLTGVQLGRGGFIGMNGYMEDYVPQNVAIEDDVTVSFGVTFIAHGWKTGKTDDEKTIILRRGAYVGAASILLPGIEIGEKAVIGAGSVVTKSVPPGAIVAGSPARIMKYRDGYEPENPRT